MRLNICDPSEALIGIVDTDAKFYCGDCASEELKKRAEAEDADGPTPIFQSDAWFTGDLCAGECGEFIERA